MTARFLLTCLDFPSCSCLAILLGFRLNTACFFHVGGTTAMNLKKCYNADGSLSSDIPCDPNANASACCRVHDARGASKCAFNLFCLDPSDALVPGTCTDHGWLTSSNPACPCPPRTLFVQFHYNLCASSLCTEQALHEAHELMDDCDVQPIWLMAPSTT